MIKKTILVAALWPLFSLADEPLQTVQVVATRDAEWAGYRHAYKANAMYAAYVRPDPLFRDVAGAAPLTIPVTDGHAFEDQTMGIYNVAIYRFADWPRDGVVLTPVKPVAIGTIHE